MAIETKTDVGSFTDWFNIPGLDGKSMGGAIGRDASIMGGLGATYGGALGLLGWLLSELFPKGGASKPIPNVSTDKVLPKDFDKYGSTVWPEIGKMVQTLPETMPEIAQTISKILPKYGSKVWPDAGKMVQTLPETGTINERIEKNFPKDYGTATWPNEGKMAQVLPNNPGKEYNPPKPNYGTATWPDEGKMVETLPLGQTAILDITTPATPPNYGTATWPDEGKMVETLPLGQTDNLEVPRPIAPGTTATPNYGTATWPDEGKMVETLPLGQTGNLEVPRPIAPGTTATPNYGTATWPDEGKMVETLPLNDTGKLDITKPIIDVRPNVDVNTGTDAGTNEWVSGAINATETWPNEGMMVESIPPYHHENIDWSGPMITDKTNENNEVTINPVTFDSFYDLIRAEQKARWEREDAIRKEVQEREDNAWQRAVADMRKAGINPNLVNAGPAESGGGISTATGMNYAMWESGLQKEIALLQQSIDQNFKGDENDKDRFVQLLGNVLSMFSVIAMFKGKI